MNGRQVMWSLTKHADRTCPGKYQAGVVHGNREPHASGRSSPGRRCMESRSSVPTGWLGRHVAIKSGRPRPNDPRSAMAWAVLSRRRWEQMRFIEMNQLPG